MDAKQEHKITLVVLLDGLGRRVANVFHRQVFKIFAENPPKKTVRRHEKCANCRLSYHNITIEAPTHHHDKT
jgi:hypothetical protein